MNQSPPIKGSEHSEQIFIFKEIKDREYVKNAVEYYCRYVDNEFASNECGFMGQSHDYFTPATKEQRNTLFKAMHEAGYMWDSESKQLLSLKAEPSGEQKSAWSEEDNKHYESCLNYFEEIKPDSVYYKDYLWLKSLKERINV